MQKPISFKRLSFSFLCMMYNFSFKCTNWVPYWLYDMWILQMCNLITENSFALGEPVNDMFNYFSSSVFGNILIFSDVAASESGISSFRFDFLAEFIAFLRDFLHRLQIFRN